MKITTLRHGQDKTYAAAEQEVEQITDAEHWGSAKLRLLADQAQVFKIRGRFLGGWSIV